MKIIIYLIVFLLIGPVNLIGQNLEKHDIDFDFHFGCNVSDNETNITMDYSITLIKGGLFSLRMNGGPESNPPKYKSWFSGSTLYRDPESFREISVLVGYPFYGKRTYIMILTGVSYIFFTEYESTDITRENKIKSNTWGPHGRLNWVIPIKAGISFSTGINYTYVINKAPSMGLNLSVSFSTIKLIKNSK